MSVWGASWTPAYWVLMQSRSWMLCTELDEGHCKIGV